MVHGTDPCVDQNRELYYCDEGNRDDCSVVGVEEEEDDGGDLPQSVSPFRESNDDALVFL